MSKYGTRTNLIAFDWYQKRSNFLPLTCCGYTPMEAESTNRGTMYLTCPECDGIVEWSHDDITLLYINHMSVGVANMSAPEGKMQLGGISE